MVASQYLRNNGLGWLIVIPFIALENLAALVIISSRNRWKSPDVLLFSITLGHVLSLLLPLLLYAVISFKDLEWSDGSCKFLVWCVMSFRIVGAVNIAFISLDRVWTLKWPSSYRAHNSARQTARTAVFMWLFGVAIGTIPLISWTNLEDQQTCSLVLNIAGYGYAMCIVIIVIGSVMVSTVCISTIVVNVVCIWPLLEETPDPKSSIPQIVIESETGERTSAVPGSRDSQNQQIYLLVSAVVILYFCVNGLPFVVVNIIAFTNATPVEWMSAAISWCSVISASLHPPLLVLICNRYRKVCVRFWRIIGESCGCLQAATPARPTLNGLARQETFDSLDDFSSDEEDKLHFPAPDWSDRSFSGSFDEGAGPSTDVVVASTSTAIQTVTVVEHSHTVRNGKIPTTTHSPRAEEKAPHVKSSSSSRGTSRSRTAPVEYDNAAFVVEDETRKHRSKKQRSPKMTPEQKRAMWQGHRGARKRLEALKQANAERAAAAHSSKGKKSKSKKSPNHATSKETSAKDTDNKNLKVDSASIKNRHRKLERLSSKQHSLDSLLIPTKRKTPLISSLSLDQAGNTLTIKADIENTDSRGNSSEPIQEENLQSSSSKSSKSDSSNPRSKKKRKQSENKKETQNNTQGAQSKDTLAAKQLIEQKANLSPSESPSRREKRNLDSASHRNPRFELARENYNSDFSSFGSGELYDIPEESPEEMLGEHTSTWPSSTVKALKAQHRDDRAAKLKQSPGSEKRLAQRKQRERERPRIRTIPDHNEPPVVKTLPPPCPPERKPPRRMLSRQMSQDHSRSMNGNSIEMIQFDSRDSAIALSTDDLDKEYSFSKITIELPEEESVGDRSTYYIPNVHHGGRAKQLKDHSEKEEGLVLDDKPLRAISSSLDGARHLDPEGNSTPQLQIQAWSSSRPSSLNNNNHTVKNDAATPRGKLNKSRSNEDRPSAKDLRERYRKSHLSMAAIFESIRDDSQEVVFL